MSNWCFYGLCVFVAVTFVVAEVIYGREVILLVRNKSAGPWKKTLAIAVLVSDAVRLVGIGTWVGQEFLPCWFVHSDLYLTGVRSGLICGPLLFPLMYLLATCVLPISPYFPFVLLSAPAAAASGVRAYTLWHSPRRSWWKIALVVWTTYLPEALLLPVLASR